MRVLSRILIVVGLLITACSNLATVYGLNASINGMQNAASNGIGLVAWGMSSAYFWSLVSLVGCFLLIVGLALAAFKSNAKAAA